MLPSISNVITPSPSLGSEEIHSSYSDAPSRRKGLLSRLDIRGARLRAAARAAAEESRQNGNDNQPSNNSHSNNDDNDASISTLSTDKRHKHSWSSCIQNSGVPKSPTDSTSTQFSSSINPLISTDFQNPLPMPPKYSPPPLPPLPFPMQIALMSGYKLHRERMNSSPVLRKIVLLQNLLKNVYKLWQVKIGMVKGPMGMCVPIMQHVNKPNTENDGFSSCSSGSDEELSSEEEDDDNDEDEYEDGNSKTKTNVNSNSTAKSIPSSKNFEGESHLPKLSSDERFPSISSPISTPITNSSMNSMEKNSSSSLSRTSSSINPVECLLAKSVLPQTSSNSEVSMGVEFLTNKMETTSIDIIEKDEMYPHHVHSGHNSKPKPTPSDMTYAAHQSSLNMPSDEFNLSIQSSIEPDEMNSVSSSSLSSSFFSTSLTKVVIPSNSQLGPTPPPSPPLEKQFLPTFSFESQIFDQKDSIFDSLPLLSPSSSSSFVSTSSSSISSQRSQNPPSPPSEEVICNPKMSNLLQNKENLSYASINDNTCINHDTSSLLPSTQVQSISQEEPTISIEKLMNNAFDLEWSLCSL